MIPDLSIWIGRKHGEVNFHLTQFISGHGCFRKYLHRFGHAISPFCPECAGTEETPEHVVFHCSRFAVMRSEMVDITGVDITPDNIVQRMCSDENVWNAVNRAIVQILSVLQRKWRHDQRVSTTESLENHDDGTAR